jgi:thiol-disulfide isomerase/thioredoxin
MSRHRIILAVCLAASVLAVASAATEDSPTQALQQQVLRLEDQVRALEAKLKALENRFREVETKAAAQASSANEPVAQALFADAQRLIGEGNYTQARTVLEELQTKHPATKAANQSRTLYSEVQVVGMDMPKDPGISKWFQGEKDVELSGKKTTLIVFWEEWCGYCKREVPKLQALYESYKDDGLQVVGLTRLTRGATEEKVKAFITENKLQYPIAHENGSMSEAFKVSGVPAAAVVKNGKVVWRGNPATLSEEMLKRWL